MNPVPVLTKSFFSIQQLLSFSNSICCGSLLVPFWKGHVLTDTFLAIQQVSEPGFPSAEVVLALSNRTCLSMYPVTLFCITVLRDCKEWKLGLVVCSSSNCVFGKKLASFASGGCTDNLMLPCCLSFLQWHCKALPAVLQLPVGTLR